MVAAAAQRPLHSRPQYRTAALMKKFNEHGQAMVEMCAVLIGMVVVILAVILIAGIGITNIKMIQEGKSQAEILALGADTAELAVRPDIFYWNYSNGTAFGGPGQPAYTTGNNDGISADALLNSGYSEASRGERIYEYDFKALDEAVLRTGHRPEVLNLGMALFSGYATAANLIYGASDYNQVLYTQRSVSDSDRQAFYKAVASWLKVEPQRMLDNWHYANRMFIPKNANGEPGGIPSSPQP